MIVLDCMCSVLSNLRRDFSFADVPPRNGYSQSGVVGSRLAHPTTSDWPHALLVPGSCSIVSGTPLLRRMLSDTPPQLGRLVASCTVWLIGSYHKALQLLLQDFEPSFFQWGVFALDKSQLI
jgi:hypothetical protein